MDGLLDVLSDHLDELVELDGFDLLQGVDPFEAVRAINDKKLSERQDIERHMKNIVLLDINVGDKNTKVLTCWHTFNHKCISEWSKRKPNCPLCRHDVRQERQPNLKRKRLSHEAEELKDETSSTHRQVARVSGLGGILEGTDPSEPENAPEFDEEDLLSLLNARVFGLGGIDPLELDSPTNILVEYYGRN
ncbi:E3 ubiquitin-protein ligase RNF8-like [Papaver somniferum]|uniref:E3 ubiquitin-protein ligase RNF8-like n=1 Tax=Papaver somniferum TaxID=3469 RepID=UPI000E6FDC09|nr:E3 ubiquitin-protein ligase RNF8-like [Papaver somniferum]